MSATPLDLPTPVVPSTREVLAQHLVDIDADRDGLVLLELADLDDARVRRVEDEVQLGAGERGDRSPMVG